MPALVKPLIIAALAVVFTVACSNDNPQVPAPEETRASLFNLQDLPKTGCPDLTNGTYELKTEDEKSQVSLAIQEKKGELHFLAVPEETQKKDFVDFMVGLFATDQGGYFMDGQIHDQTEPIRRAGELLTGIVKSFRLNIIASLVKFKLQDELKKYDFDKLEMAYSAGCVDDRIVLHYVFGKSAFKYKLKTLDNTSVILNTFEIHDDGPLIEKTATGTYLNSEIIDNSALREFYDFVTGD